MTDHPCILRRLCLALAAAAVFAGPPQPQAADPLPQASAELIQKRAEMGRGANVFDARAWAPPPKKVKRVVLPQAISPAPPPTPPALPFTYGGSGVVNGQPILFLEREGGSRMVQAGDIVDAAYRIEAIERNRVTLRYLPLGVIQVMMFGSPELTVRTPNVARQRLQGPLIVDVPDEAPLDQEVPLLLGILPGSGAARATVTLNYDESALSVLGAKIVRPGRAVIEMSAQDATPSKELQLKPLGMAASSTEIAIDVVAFDEQGGSLAIRLPPHYISLLEAAN